jgi:hypothetical protein
MALGATQRLGVLGLPGSREGGKIGLPMPRDSKPPQF